MAGRKAGVPFGKGRFTSDTDMPERVAHGVRGREWADQFRKEDEQRKGGKR